MNRVWWHRDLLLILGAAFFFVFLGAGSVSFLDPDEGMYGSIAREMAEGGDWVTPHFNGVRYLEKPPLYFWLTALTIVFFGPTEWAVRVWSGLPALGTALLLWRLGDRFYGRFAGIAAPIIFMSGVGVFRYVRVTATDFLLVFSLTLALYGFCRAKLDHGSGLILFYLGMALGVLSKGLVGVVFPVLTVGLFLWCEEHPGTWGLFRKRIVSIYRFLLGNRFGWTGLFIFSLLTVPWHLLAGWRNSGFFEFYVLDNQLLRFLNDRSFVEDDVPIGTLAFLLMILLWFFPWSLVLPVAWRQGFSNPGQAPSPQSLRLLVGLWALVVTVFFSLTSLKLEHYFLPAIPPLSLMVAGTWDGALHSFRSSMQFTALVGHRSSRRDRCGVGHDLPE